MYDLSTELSSLNDAFATTFDGSDWRIGLLEEKDLDRAVDISMDGFFRPKIILNEKGMGSFEKNFARNVIGVYTDFERKEAKFSNYIGFKTRSNGRLSNPSLEPSKYSFILAVSDMSTNMIVGIVEVSLEEPNGMLATPIQSPFKREPRISDMPYLCNLCIDGNYRRKGLGRLLCTTCENIVSHFWKKDTIYLHVEAGNIPAQRLYKDMGYVHCKIETSVWQRRITGIDDNVLYFRKQLVIPKTAGDDAKGKVGSIYADGSECSNFLSTANVVVCNK